MGWDQEALAERRLPTRGDIDDLSPDNPVALSRVCGHIMLLNSRAIEALGMQERQGVQYDRDLSGRLTGVIRERAMEEALSRIPDRTAQQCADDLLSAEFDAARQGLTTLHCILSPDGYPQELEALAAVAGSGGSSLRYRVYVPTDAMKLLDQRELPAKLAGTRMRIAGVKIFTDGSLGASTAALWEPYSDDPSNSGQLRYTDDELAAVVDKVDSAGYQAIVHAIGDRAIEQAIGAISACSGSGNPRRHRIEHASLAPKELRSKMKKHSIRATVQPHFVISDSWAVQRLGGERVADLYPFRSIVDEGIVASGGSDAPVEPISPIVGMWASMVRAGYSPEQRLDLGSALMLYLDSAALNGFDEDEAGIRVGARADFTLLDSDVEGMHAAMLRKVGVAATIVGGELVYSFEGGGPAATPS